MVLVTLGQSSLQLFISKYIGTGSLSFSRGFWITVQDVSGHFSHLHIGGKLEQICIWHKMLTWAWHLRASWSYWYLGRQHAWRLSKSGDFEYHQRCEIIVIVYWGSTHVHLVMVGTASRRVWKTAHLWQMWNQKKYLISLKNCAEEGDSPNNTEEENPDIVAKLVGKESNQGGSDEDTERQDCIPSEKWNVS